MKDRVLFHGEIIAMKLLQNHWVDLTKFGIKHPWVTEMQFKWRTIFFFNLFLKFHFRQNVSIIIHVALSTLVFLFHVRDVACHVVNFEFTGMQNLHVVNFVFPPNSKFTTWHDPWTCWYKLKWWYRIFLLELSRLNVYTHLDMTG